MTARVGPIGRLGRYTATHFRTVLVAWIVALALGFFGDVRAPATRVRSPGSVWIAAAGGSR